MPDDTNTNSGVEVGKIINKLLRIFCNFKQGDLVSISDILPHSKITVKKILFENFELIQLALSDALSYHLRKINTE